ncbi:MAG: right-handed parallel beta-helix repeat-containing protein [Clostridia bacterium]|nr:right-handed parallel beta-helix repeat-containing protein [Clostridia bacterium]
MRKTKILAMVLCVAMVLSTMGFTVFAEEATPVATVNGVEYTDIQEAIKKAAPNGTVEIKRDITVDEWIMFAESLTIGSGQIITEVIDGLTINGNEHSLTINSVESAKNGGYLFFDATELNIEDLTINYPNNGGGIGLKSGTISNVTINGGNGIYPGDGDLTITDCTFNTTGAAIYNEAARNNLVVTGNTFNVQTENGYAIYLRGNTTFTNNEVTSGRVNVVSGSPVVTGNDFNDVRFKVYNVATATIENNEINNLLFNDDSEVKSTFADNTLSEAAQTVFDAAKFPGPVKVTTYEELIAALAKDNANVIMMNDITATATQSNGYGKTGIVVDAGDILDGNGKTLTINGANNTWDSVIGMKGGEVKNLTIAGAMRGVFMPGANGDVVVDNCVFKDVIYTFNSDAGSKNYTVAIKNSALNGWTSFSNVHKSVTFENCTFGEGSGYKFCRPYQATEFNGCNFDTGYEFDASQTAANSLVFNDCTYAGAPLSASNGWQMFSAGSDVIIDGEKVHFINSGAVVACIGNTAYDNLQDALNAAVTAGKDVTVEILTDINLENVDWTPVSVNGAVNPAAHLVTVNGNNHKITKLNNMLFSGTWAGQSGLIINDLTIADSNIVNDKDDTAGTVGVGAFIGYPQASETVTLNNCHLVKSTVEGGHWTGGLIGMAGGYNGNDGPVFMNLTITGCSVKDSVIKGKGSAGGLMGHASCAAWTNVTVEDTVVSGNTVTSTGSSNEKAGAVFGTVGAAGTAATAAGETKTGGQFVAATVKNNTVTSNDTTITTIYGRQGTPTGKLELTGGSYDHKPISGEEAWAGVKAGFVLEENSDGTYGIKSHWVTDTDAGYYMSAESKLGLMRYLFHFGIEGTISDAGVKFIKGDDISAQVGNIATSEEKSNTFYADINNIPDETTGKYYAVGFVTIGEKTYWSNPIFCEPNFTRYFSKYTGGAE